jgi:hypothetical protein
MTIVFVHDRWEGSAHDGQVLRNAFTKRFSVSKGKYYLGDAGYELSQEVLTPYIDVRYHLQEQQQSDRQ